MRRAGTVLAMAVTFGATSGRAAENTIVLEDQTLAVVSSLAVYHPGDELLELHFFPVELTAEQQAKAISDSPGALSFDLESPDPERWENCPMATLNMSPVGPDLRVEGRPSNLTISTLHLKGAFYNTASSLSGDAVPGECCSLEARDEAGDEVVSVRVKLSNDDLSIDLEQEVVVHTVAE